MKSNFKRSYLNTEETNMYMLSKSFIQVINGERNMNNKTTNEIWVEWDKRGMITPEMKKNIKLVRTYLSKFCYEIEDNVDERELKRLNKKIENFDYRLVDDYTLKKIFKDIEDRSRYFVIDKEKLYPILAELMEVSCVSCKKDYKSCDLYNMFDDLLINKVNECSNCPYACDLSSLDEEDKKIVNELKAKMKAKNKVGKGIVSESDT